MSAPFLHKFAAIGLVSICFCCTIFMTAVNQPNMLSATGLKKKVSTFTNLCLCVFHNALLQVKTDQICQRCLWNYFAWASRQHSKMWLLFHAHVLITQPLYHHETSHRWNKCKYVVSTQQISNHLCNQVIHRVQIQFQSFAKSKHHIFYDASKLKPQVEFIFYERSLTSEVWVWHVSQLWCDFLRLVVLIVKVRGSERVSSVSNTRKVSWPINIELRRGVDCMTLT